MSFFDSKPEPEQAPQFIPRGTRVWEQRKREDAFWNRLLLALVGVILLACIAAGLIKVLGYARESARNSTCKGHLSQCGLALHNYVSDHGCFPPAYTVDDQGRKMHSWRALLLPYLDPTLASKYDLNEPWDGPNNRRLWDQMPTVYRCPSDDSSPANTTRYFAIVGPTTMWPGEKGVTSADITDGLSNTIAIVEANHDAVPWLEPRDLDWESFQKIIADKSSKQAMLSSHGGDETNVLLADGSTRFFLKTINPGLLNLLLTIAGAEQPGEYDFPSDE